VKAFLKYIEMFNLTALEIHVQEFARIASHDTPPVEVNDYLKEGFLIEL
jgi:hypothetical protein